MRVHILVALCTIMLSLPGYAQKITLKVAHFLSSQSHVQKKVLEPWCESLKQESGGRITCQFYPSMQLGGTPAQLVDQVRNGVADVVWTAPGYSSGRFPAIEAFEMPFMVRDAISGSQALWQYYQRSPEVQKEFDAYKVLAFHVDGGQAIHSAKKELKTPADLQGVKLRTSTRLGARTLMALGGLPVAMPPAQTTEAISKGVIDGAMASWELVTPTKLDEVTHFHLQPAAGGYHPSATVLTILMNKKKYKSLAPDLKDIVERHSSEMMVRQLGETFENVINQERQATLSRGEKINEFSEAMLQEMRQASASVEQEWIQLANDKGLDGTRLAVLAREISADTLSETTTQP